MCTQGRQVLPIHYCSSVIKRCMPTWAPSALTAMPSMPPTARPMSPPPSPNAGMPGASGAARSRCCRGDGARRPEPALSSSRSPSRVDGFRCSALPTESLTLLATSLGKQGQGRGKGGNRVRAGGKGGVRERGETRSEPRKSRKHGQGWGERQALSACGAGS
eukprot:354551-Chlamydomonas_euryale.AAC.13